MKEFSSSSLSLWQLISPALPIGAYAYSQGLEYAVESGWVKDESTASEWILGQVKNNLASLEVPVFFRLYRAWQEKDIEAVQHWNGIVLALRETRELRQEDCQLGKALTRLLTDLDIHPTDLESDDVAFVTVFAFACQYWSIDMIEAVHGLLWSWCENQVAAAIKLIPLGQTSGQRIMLEARQAITQAIDKGIECEDDAIGMMAYGLAHASALHETQYSRLFRS